jgi:hypothetical protein
LPSWLQFLNYNEMIAATEEKTKRKSGTQNVKTCRLQGGDKFILKDYL